MGSAALDYNDKVRKQEKIISEIKFHQSNRMRISEVVGEIQNKNGRILEIGCGYGDITRNFIAPNCHTVVATDIVKRYIGEEIAGNAKFQLEDALNLSFPGETFDGVVSVDVLEHVNDAIGFIKESLRVLKKGGVLFFTTPNRLRFTSLLRYAIGKPIKFPHCYAYDTVLGDILHLREFSLADLHKFLKNFPVASVEIKGFWFGIPAWQIGIADPPKFFQRWAFSWHVKMIKK